MQNVLFLFGTDCSSKAIFVSFPSILYQSTIDCKWHGFLIPLIKPLPFNKFTLNIYPLLNGLNSLKRKKKSKRKQELRKRSIKKKGYHHNLFLKIQIKAVSCFPLQVKPIHNEVVELHMAGGKKNTLTVLCICVYPCLSHIIQQLSNTLINS